MIGRQNTVAKLRKQNPCFTLQQIGDLAGGISRERVRQILKDKNMPTIHERSMNHRCANCNQKFYNWSKTAVFCSMDCRKEYSRGLFTCDYCGRVFKRHVSQVAKNMRMHPEINNPHVFCDRHCFGKYVAKLHGFKRKPELHEIVQIECGRCHKKFNLTRQKVRAHERRGNHSYVCSMKCQMELVHLGRKRKAAVIRISNANIKKTSRQSNSDSRQTIYKH